LAINHPNNVHSEEVMGGQNRRSHVSNSRVLTLRLPILF